MAVEAVPKRLQTLTPYLVIHDAGGAIEFYKRAFGAQEVLRLRAPDGGSIWHAELRIGDSTFFLADEAMSVAARSARSYGGSPITLQLNVEDADRVAGEALAAGAQLKMPVSDMFWGDRYGQVTDPFGYTWALSTHVRDVTLEEMEQAARVAAAQYNTLAAAAEEEEEE